jgi:predicted DNA-binding transcriptional regulator YafY
MELATRPLLLRLLVLDRLHRGDRYPNARTAAQELEVHPRTVHRDLEFLRDSLGAPLEFCRRHNGYYYRDADYALPLVRLTEGELIALFLAERLLDEYRGTPYVADLAAASGKLDGTVVLTLRVNHLLEFKRRRRRYPGSRPP